jgi:hypothetical protein
LSFDNRVWQLFPKRADSRKGDGVARFELLVGVTGSLKSSSGHPLNLLSYDLWVFDVELKAPALARIGVLGGSLVLL